MKTYLTLSLLMAVLYNSYGQIDNTIYIGAMTEIQEPEDKLIDKIEDKQVTLTYSTTAMSVSSVLMANTEMKLHKGLTEVYKLIDNAGIILTVLNESKQILEIQDAILEESKGEPELMAYSAYHEVVWIKKSYAVMVQLIMATKESKFSLLSNFQRLELLHNTAEALKEIKKETIKLYLKVKAMKTVINLEIGEILLEYDFSEEIEYMEIQIANLAIL